MIWIVALNGGVIVSPRIIREFLNVYKGNLNKLVRDATRNQRVVDVETFDQGASEGDEEETTLVYQAIKVASDAEEVLNMLSPLFKNTHQTVAQIEYACREAGMLVFRISH